MPLNFISIVDNSIWVRACLGISPFLCSLIPFKASVCDLVFFFTGSYALKSSCSNFVQATVIDPADVSALESALNNNKVHTVLNHKVSYLFPSFQLLAFLTLFFRFHSFSQSRQQILFSGVWTLRWFQSYVIVKEHWFVWMEHLQHLWTKRHLALALILFCILQQNILLVIMM